MRRDGRAAAFVRLGIFKSLRQVMIVYDESNNFTAFEIVNWKLNVAKRLDVD